MPARSEPAARELKRWHLWSCTCGEMVRPLPFGGPGCERCGDAPSVKVEVVPASERDQWRKAAEDLAAKMDEWPADDPGRDEATQLVARFFDALSAGEPGKEGA